MQFAPEGVIDIRNKSCLDNGLESKTIDLMVTDPPFGIGFGSEGSYNRNSTSVLSGYNEIQPEMYFDFTKQWLSEAKRILKKNGSIYIFSGWTNLSAILVALKQLGFTLVNDIIWQYNFGVFCRRRYVTSHYHILYACLDDNKREWYPQSDDTKAEYADSQDVWKIDREYWPGAIKTPTKLPRAVIEKILNRSSRPGDLICDFFSGSGQVAWASQAMGRNCIAFEIDPTIFAYSQRRFELGKYILFPSDLTQ